MDFKVYMLIKKHMKLQWNYLKYPSRFPKKNVTH
jgi:hypothetical protein